MVLVSAQAPYSQVAWFKRNRSDASIFCVLTSVCLVMVTVLRQPPLAAQVLHLFLSQGG